jgi:hypothetical protein
MNKKFLLAAGAVILTAAGAFAGRMSKKGDATALFASFGSGAANCRQVTNTFTAIAGVLTTGSTVGNQATILTVNNTSHKLFATSACNTASAVRYHG